MCHRLRRHDCLIQQISSSEWVRVQSKPPGIGPQILVLGSIYLPLPDAAAWPDVGVSDGSLVAIGVVGFPVKVPSYFSSHTATQFLMSPEGVLPGMWPG